MVHWDLTPSERHTFDTTGLLVRAHAFDPAEVQALKEALDRVYALGEGLQETTDLRGARFVIAATGHDGGPRVQRVVWCGAADPALAATGTDPRVLGPALSLLGAQSADQLINQAHFKQPGDGVAFSMHQDAWNRRFGTELWLDHTAVGGYVQSVLTVDEMTATNGPLLYVPGSHRLGLLDEPRRDDAVRDILKQTPPQALVAPPVALIFFGPYLLHGSTANESEGPRRIVVNGYARPGVNRREYPGAGLGVTRALP